MPLFKRKRSATRVRELEAGLTQANAHIADLQHELSLAAKWLEHAQHLVDSQNNARLELNEMDNLIINMAAAPDRQTADMLLQNLLKRINIRTEGSIQWLMKPPQASQLAASPTQNSSTISARPKSAPR